MAKRIICPIMAIFIMISIQSCTKSDVTVPDFRIAIVGGMCKQPFYEISHGAMVTAALYDEYKVAFTKGRDLKTWTEDIFIQKKERKLSRKEKEMISHYIQNILQNQPQKSKHGVPESTSNFDIVLYLNGKTYTSKYEMDEGQMLIGDEDPDMIRLMQYLMKIVPFKDDDIWGSTYKLILESKQD